MMGAVVLAAIVMGLPTLYGGFVGGDDHRLVLDHVLVNHPSLEHAVRLFTIVHRDLYQPLPLLMFSGEFALASALGLWESGPRGGAWLFHLTNVLLHALNAWLVWRVVWNLNLAAQKGERRLGPPTGSDDSNTRSTAWVATAAALLFAVHPLGVETVAWINGRMMLLSTLFGLCAVLAFLRWLQRGRTTDAALTMVCVILSAISKVRVGLPLLLALAGLLVLGKPRKRFWTICLTAGLITGFFAWINVGATSQADLFSEAAEHLQGPRAVRVLLALANYFSHIVWPVGLTSYYPTPPVVHWSDAETIEAAWITFLGLATLGVCCRFVPAARWGTAWFFVAIADTLPFIPARNVLAADRYTYLPLVGMFWALAASAVAVYAKFAGSPVSRAPRWFVGAAATLIVPALIGTSWSTARWYNTPELKTERVARVFPHVPRVWERFGWTRYSNGEYDEAAELARKELVHDIPSVQSGAYQLLGMCAFKQGDIDVALGWLRKALAVDPDNSVAKFRLGLVHDELGRDREALPYYEACVADAPSHNPTIHRLARIYRRLGRLDDARRMYEQELSNNRFEVPAIMALADLDFSLGTPDAVRAARDRLVALIDWMPENVAARINLAHLYDAMGDDERAIEQYAEAERQGLETVEQKVFISDFFEKRGDLPQAVMGWRALIRRLPSDAAARAHLAWLLAIAGDVEGARTEIAALGAEARNQPMAQAAVMMLALNDGRNDVAAALADQLASSGPNGGSTRRRLLQALERYDQKSPDNPWTYYLTATLLIGDGQTDAGRAFAELFNTRCNQPECEPFRSALAARVGYSNDRQSTTSP